MIILSLQVGCCTQMSRLTLPSTLPRTREKIQNKKKIADCCVFQRRKVSTLGCYLVTSSKEKRKITQSSVSLCRCGPRGRFSFFIFFFPSSLTSVYYTHTHNPCLILLLNSFWLAVKYYSTTRCAAVIARTRKTTPAKIPPPRQRRRSSSSPPTRIFCVKIFFDFF